MYGARRTYNFSYTTRFARGANELGRGMELGTIDGASTVDGASCHEWS